MPNRNALPVPRSLRFNPSGYIRHHTLPLSLPLLFSFSFSSIVLLPIARFPDPSFSQQQATPQVITVRSRARFIFSLSFFFIDIVA